MYGAWPPIGAAAGGASAALSVRGRPESGFQALAAVVAATTLFMAGVSVGKLLPRPRADAAGSPRPVRQLRTPSSSGSNRGMAAGSHPA